MNRAYNAVAWLVVAPMWAFDRLLCRLDDRRCGWANESHLPMENER